MFRAKLSELLQEKLQGPQQAAPAWKKIKNVFESLHLSEELTLGQTAAPSVLKSLGVSYLFPPSQLRHNLH